MTLLPLASFFFCTILGLTTVGFSASRHHASDVERHKAELREYAHRVGYWTARMEKPKPQSPPQSSFWDQVVGIPLDDWHAADSPQALGALIARRDNRWADAT